MVAYDCTTEHEKNRPVLVVDLDVDEHTRVHVIDPTMLFVEEDEGRALPWVQWQYLSCCPCRRMDL